MLNNRFWGSTIREAGGTYLLSKAILTVEEGYSYGSTTEYAHIGEFYTDSFNNNGIFNEVIDIDATDMKSTLNNTNVFFPRLFEKNFYYIDRFVDPNLAFSNYNRQGNWGITTGIGIATGGTNGYFLSADAGIRWAEVNTKLLRDYRVSASMFCNNFSTTASAMGFLLRSNTPGDGYIMVLERRGGSGGSNVLTLYNFVNGVGSTLQSVVGPSAGGSFLFYMSANVYENRIQGSFGTRLAGLSKYIDFYDHTISHASGFTGVYVTSGATSVNAGINQIEISEISNQYTVKEITENVLKAGEVWNVDIAKEIDDTYLRNMRFEWGTSIGATNMLIYGAGITPTNILLGPSMIRWFTTGATFFNFVLECEVRGVSGAHFGLFAFGGLTQRSTYLPEKVGYGYANLMYFGPSIQQGNIINEFTGLSLGAGATLMEHSNINTHLSHLVPQEWYKIKFINNNNTFSWFVNNKLSGAITADSQFFTENGWDIGIMIKNGGSGMSLAMRDFHISSLGLVTDDITVESNNTIAATLSRILPDGFVTKMSGNTMAVYNIGVSRGVYNFGNTYNLIDIRTGYNNVNSQKYSNIRSTSVFATQDTVIPRTLNQMNKAFSDFTVQTNIQNETDAKKIAQASLEQFNRGTETIDVQIPPQLTLEQYDVINLSSSVMGIGSSYIVYNSTKNYSANGNFTQTLVLGLNDQPA